MPNFEGNYKIEKLVMNIGNKYREMAMFLGSIINSLIKVIFFKPCFSFNSYFHFLSVPQSILEFLIEHEFAEAFADAFQIGDDLAENLFWDYFNLFLITQSPQWIRPVRANICPQGSRTSIRNS